MNWGLKIIIGLGTFMLFIVSAGIYMVTKNTDTLEEADYYEKSLSYDDVYQQKENLLKDKATPAILIREDTLWIDFRKSNNQGQLIFKRPSDSSQDLTVAFETVGSIYKLPVSRFAKGNWQLEIAWKRSGRAYISDHNLFL
ncbi:FixH family protein [Sphingobacterium sp. LRF_L2]|uniref:FixH family protein n=1 Tax=Sphingobacterium sp. LRF_L2 TaxID=3369421 RepID=UPI003F648D86